MVNSNNFSISYFFSSLNSNWFKYIKYNKVHSNTSFSKIVINNIHQVSLEFSWIRTYDYPNRHGVFINKINSIL